MHLDLLTKRVASFAAYAFSVRSKHNTSEKEFFFLSIGAPSCVAADKNFLRSLANESMNGSFCINNFL